MFIEVFTGSEPKCNFCGLSLRHLELLRDALEQTYDELDENDESLVDDLIRELTEGITDFNL